MPTLRQTRAVKIMVENGRNGIIEPMGKVLAKVGYSEAIQQHPNRVTKSKTFQDLLEQFIPENKLAKKHKELLNAVCIDNFVFPNDMNDDEIKEVIEAVPNNKLVRIERSTDRAKAYYTTPDNKTQFKALELAYKIRKKLGNYKDESDNDNTPEIEAFLTWVRNTLPASQ